MRQWLDDLQRELGCLPVSRDSVEYQYLQKIHSTISEYYFLTSLLERHLWLDVQEHQLKTQQQALRQWLQEQIPGIESRLRQATGKVA